MTAQQRDTPYTRQRHQSRKKRHASRLLSYAFSDYPSCVKVKDIDAIAIAIAAPNVSLHRTVSLLLSVLCCLMRGQTLRTIQLNDACAQLVACRVEL